MNINCPILSSNSELRDKVEVLRYLRLYMDTELYSFVEMNDLEPSNDLFIASKISHLARRLSSKDLNDDPAYLTRLNLDASESSSNGSSNSKPVFKEKSNMAHIVDFRKLSDSLLMLMSDGTCQVLLFFKESTRSIRKLRLTFKCWCLCLYLFSSLFFLLKHSSFLCYFRK